jgi:diaminopimelate epimerase
MTLLPSRRFWKMTGSGNDFVFFDARSEPAGILESPAAIAALCDRRMGVGADGVVFLERDPAARFGIRYFNRDGSLAELCGNASLCAVSLTRELQLATLGEDFHFGTTSGPLTGRLTATGPEIDTTPVTDETARFDTPVVAGERRIGFARVGVPHLVVLCDDVESVDVEGRGRQLRSLPQLAAGANANFVARQGSHWAVRTYERGVEEETLACGTGAVATAALLGAWTESDGPVTLRTRSGADLIVRFGKSATGAQPSLSGEGRLVYDGVLRTLQIPD